MDKPHSAEFMRLRECFNEIAAYHKGSNADINRYAQLFFFELGNIDIQFQMNNRRLLKDAEIPYVQKFINRITGNREISKRIRLQILEESLNFNEMAEIRRRQLSSNLGI